VVLGFTGTTTKLMLPAKGETVLVRGENGGWIPKVKQTLYDYRVNRKEANNVRKLVSQFKDYLSGVIKLKAEERVINEGTYYEQRLSLVKSTYGELIEVFGKSEDAYGAFRPKVNGWQSICNKPKYYGGDKKAEVWAEYFEKTAQFFDLVRNDQDDSARHQNYWIAYNILLIQGQSLYWRDSMESQVTLGTGEFEKVLDMALFKMFADRVFKKVALPEGRVPTHKYADYVVTEED
jgi:hypothetical protein